MNDPFLWFIDYHGSLYKYVLKTNEWHRISRENENSRRDTFKRISSTKTCAWSVGGDQNIHVSVYKTDLPIRVCESTYENQRWSVRSGWTSELLFTDRWSWSSKDGKKEMRRDDFDLPSEYWVWEAEWYVDLSTDCDLEGWQYAMDFPAHYHSSPGRLSFVRRRKWSRYRAFVGFNQWMKVTPLSTEDPFQDVCIGGEQLHGQVQGFLSVWAVTFSGQIIFRDGVTRTCPTGVRWVKVSTDDLNLVQISVGPTGLLWGCTWDGNAVVRKGITHSKPMGSSWLVINSPVDNPLYQVAVGAEALWAVAKNSKIFFRRGVTVESTKVTKHHGHTKVHGNWVEMCGESMFITVGPNEQVWSIGKDDRKLYTRTNVTSKELVGREWQLLKLDENIQNINQVALQWYWIDSGSCDVDSTYFASNNLFHAASRSSLSSLSSDWRKSILKSLTERNTGEMTSSGDYEYALDDKEITPWNKRCDGLILLDRFYDNWCKCHMKLISDSQNMDRKLFVYYKEQNDGKYKELVFHQKHFQCLYRYQNFEKPYTLCVQISDDGKTEQLVILAFDSEKTLLEWLGVLKITVVDNLTSDFTALSLGRLSRPSDSAVNSDSHPNDSAVKSDALENTSKIQDPFDSTISAEHSEKLSTHQRQRVFDSVSDSNHPQSYKFWVTTKLGHIYQSNADSFYTKFWKQRWKHIDGHLRQVLTGCHSNVIWGIGCDGICYRYKPEKSYQMTSFVQHEIYENQRWNPVQGYSDRLLPSDRWHWSSIDGRHHYTKENYTLPSTSFKWQNEWSILFKDADHEGWQYAVDFPRHFHQHRGIHDYVRRRKWNRVAKVTTTGPWEEIKSDVRVVDLAIGMDEELLSIWAVSVNGDLLARTGVTQDTPEGVSWRYIPTDMCITSVSIGYKSRVWCVGCDGSCNLRMEISTEQPFGKSWIHIYKEEYLLQNIFAGRYVVLALDQYDNLLRRSDVNDAYPEGTQWQPFLEHVTNASVNINDDVCIVQDNQVKVLVLDNQKNLSTTYTLLLDGWESVCCRSFPLKEQRRESTRSDTSSTTRDDVDEPDTTTKQPDLSLDGENTVEKIDPYAIDIYSFYSKKDES